MKILLNLSALALEPLAEMAGVSEVVDVREGLEAAGSVVGFLAGRFRDHSKKLDTALRKANDRAWKGLEAALAKPSILGWVKGCVTTSADDKAFSRRVEAFLTALPPVALPGNDPKRFREECLLQLKKARTAGLLDQGTLDPADLAQQAVALATLGDQVRRLDAEWGRLDAIAGVLRAAKLDSLAAFLLLGRSGKEPSVLVSGVRYFFRRAVEEDQKLFQGLAFAKLERLSERQEQGFEAFEQLLDEQGQKLEGLLDEVLAVALETLENTETILAELRQLREVVAAFLKEKNLQKTVDPTTSRSIRSERERELVKEFLRRYRALPEEARNSDPNILNDLGILEMAVNDPKTAQECFQQTIAISTDDGIKAQAHYNAYRAYLEQDDRSHALAELLAAARLDPERFSPFPIDKYEPQRIVGHGGFGVAFLCRHRRSNGLRIIKSIRAEVADFEPGAVLCEGQALESLSHPNIIRLTECDYADKAEKRPYLVMEFFDGPNLAEYVKTNGPISAADFLPLARIASEGLAHAHANKIVHRDAKPANLLVRKAGPVWEAKWIDFGLAVCDVAAALTNTHQPSGTPGSGDIAGTLDYAAPEQMGKGDGPVGPHSDVYGFGRLSYFALLGSPHPDDDDKDGLPEGWRNLLRACTATKVAKRLPNFAEVLKQLDRLDSGKREQEEENERKRKAIEERERLRLAREKEERERLQQEGEQKLTGDDTKAAGELMRRHGVPTERGQELVREERRRWEAERPKPPNAEPVAPKMAPPAPRPAPPNPGDVLTVTIPPYERPMPPNGSPCEIALRWKAT